MKNIIKGLAVAVCFSGILTGCTKNFEYYNTNKHGVTEEQLDRDNLKVGAYFNQMERSVFIYNDGVYFDSDYQIMYNLIADSYAGYLAPTIANNGGVHCGSYFMTQNWSRSLFANKYTYCMAAWTQIANALADEPDSPSLALAKIVKVASMHHVTDYYGPVPYSEVGNGLSAAYDSQEDIYRQFFAELDEAIEVLTEYRNVNAGMTVLEAYDYVYSGNVTKWLQFANSLRLRLAMRVVYADEALAKTEAEKAANDGAGLMTLVSDMAALDKSLSGGYTHPVSVINTDFNDGDTQMGASMDSYLNGYKDPRLAIYFKEAGKGGYHGVRNGIHTTVWTPYRNATGNVSAPKLSDAQLVWMNAAEVAFLCAEGALRGWNMGGTAQEFYEKGIALSFEETGASGVADYIADNTSVPADFVDATGNGGNIAAMSDVTIAWDNAADFEISLEKIMTQKWIAIYPNGAEAWAEYRRTGYPELFPVLNNDSEGAVNTDLQIRRIPYPYDEYSLNAAAVAGGVNKLGGSDNAGTKLWWDKKAR